MLYRELSYTEPEISFDQHFHERGGLLPYRYVPYGEMLKATLDVFAYRIDSYQHAIPAFPVVNYNFIANTSVNAVASKATAGQGYFLGLHMGTFHVLNDLFLRMLSSSRILPAVGDSSNEKATCKLFNSLLTDYNQLVLAKAKDPESFMPVDIRRAYYASHLAKTALYFLFNHECGHIVSGHVAFLAESRHILAVDERRSADDRLSGLDSQTLEMDADGFAAHHGILQLQEMIEVAGKVSQEKSAFFVDWDTALFNWVFAVYSLFRLFGEKQYDIQDLVSYTHPPPAIRLRLMLLNIHGLLRDRLQVTLTKETFTLLFDAIGHAERAFQEISDTELAKDFLDLAYSPAGEKHMEALLGNWPAIRAQLQPHHHGYLGR